MSSFRQGNRPLLFKSMSSSVERCVLSGSPNLVDDEELLLTLTDVSLTFNDTTQQGRGTLFVTTQALVWSHDLQTGFRIDLLDLPLHATCNDLSIFPEPNIYCQFSCSDDDIPAVVDDGDVEEKADIEDVVFRDARFGVSTDEMSRFELSTLVNSQ